MRTLSTVQMCGNGLHEMTPENTRVVRQRDRGAARQYRRCVACRQEYLRRRWRRSSAEPGREGGYTTRRELVEQAIARGELLEDIAARLGVSVERCYRIADAMDEAVG